MSIRSGYRTSGGAFMGLRSCTSSGIGWARNRGKRFPGISWRNTWPVRLLPSGSRHRGKQPSVSPWRKRGLFFVRGQGQRVGGTLWIDGRGSCVAKRYLHARGCLSIWHGCGAQSCGSNFVRGGAMGIHQSRRVHRDASHKEKSRLVEVARGRVARAKSDRYARR